MKNFKRILLTMIAVIFMAFSSQAFAEGVGFVDYKKIQDNYPYAQSVAKEIDNKGLAPGFAISRRRWC